MHFDYHWDKKQLTPIFVDLETLYFNSLQSSSLNFQQQDKIDLYTPELDPLLATKSYILAPRYYIIINPPANNPNALLSPLKINIHKSPNSQLQNKFRVLLFPSVDTGINACYKVNYYEWKPLLNLPGRNINVNKVLEQYWYVPNLDLNEGDCFNNYFRNFFYLDYYYCLDRLTTKKVSVNRVNTNNNTYIDTISDKDYADIFAFNSKSDIKVKENTSAETFSFNSETLGWDFGEIVTSTRFIRPGTSVAIGNIEVDISYIKPFNLDEVIIQNKYLELMIN